MKIEEEKLKIGKNNRRGGCVVPSKHIPLVQLGCTKIQSDVLKYIVLS